ncbi:MAG: DUF1565 domain-containing protein [Candidatus Moranbacteria bacterium]|nr:DUF1565 domain-containing protein [Candidatus Moranbacteria bacterium]
MTRSHQQAFAAMISMVCLTVFLGLYAGSVSASGYDYYVEKGNDGDGSSDDPFGSIGDALDEAADHGKKTVFVKSGTYGGSLTLPKGVTVVGADEKGTIIDGSVRMEDGSGLRKLTVTGGGVTVPSGADAKLEGVRIRNVSNIGINADPGKGTVEVIGCVIEKGRKGLYIQAGRTIEMEDCEVMNNSEEGLDIRQNVAGWVKSSTFSDNGESGIEIILGSSEFRIQSSTFSGNGASGIAAQYVDVSKKTGDVRITGNILRGNDNFGIACKIPQGGPKNGDYFLNSMTVSENTYSNNKEGDISKRCRVLTDEELAELEKEEAAKAKQETLVTTAPSMTEQELAERNRQATQERRAFEDDRESREKERISSAFDHLDALLRRAEQAERDLSDRSKTTYFLIGPDRSAEAEQVDLLNAVERSITTLSAEIPSLVFESARRDAEELLEARSESLTTLRSSADQRKSATGGFSLFGWAWSLFDRRGTDAASGTTSATFFPEEYRPSVAFVGELSYVASQRSRAITHGDTAYFGGADDILRGFDVVAATITAPMLRDADPVSSSSSVSAPIPSRFASLFASRAIGVVSIGLPKTVTEDGRSRTDDHLAGSGIVSPDKVSARIGIGRHAVTIVGYAEGGTETEESVLERISEAHTEGGAVAVMISWNATDISLSEPRKALVSRFADHGADLIIGSGIPRTAGSATIANARVFYSLGNIFLDASNATAEDTTDRSLISLSTDESGMPSVTVHRVMLDGNGGIRRVENQE